VWSVTDVSEEHIASIFRVEKISKQPAWKQVARWKRYVPQKRRLTLNGLHGVISQKMVLFMSLLRSCRRGWPPGSPALSHLHTYTVHTRIRRHTSNGVLSHISFPKQVLLWESNQSSS
jgi:hypothetical protein